MSKKCKCHSISYDRDRWEVDMGTIASGKKQQQERDRSQRVGIRKKAMKCITSGDGGEGE